MCEAITEVITPDPIVLTLPEPPSGNRYWRLHGNRIYRTRDAEAYIKMVAVSAHGVRKNGGPAFPEGDVTIIVTWHRSAKRGDLPNRTKILYDALEGTLYSNDNQISQEWTRRVDAHEIIPKGCVRVEVCAANPL